jgi:hypothetical protein
MAADRTGFLGVPAAAALLLWPAIWNGYPIVFADTGTYLSQAIHHYAGWDRPVFYSLFMLPLHATVTVWPVIVVQAVLTAWILWRVCRALLPRVSFMAFVGGTAVLALGTWLPWIVSELMPDIFTPLLVLSLCLLVWVPELLSRYERFGMIFLAAFMIASQQSSVPLACLLMAILAACREAAMRRGRSGRSDLRRDQPRHEDDALTRPARRPPPLRLLLPPAVALLALCSANLVAHGRFAVSPFGNVFLLARVIYDGPGMAVLRRDCPAANWRLCPFLEDFPSSSDDFLWAPGGPLDRAGGAKAVSHDADAIIGAALIADPVGEARAALSNTLQQLGRFASGDGLTPWAAQVTPWIEHDFPARQTAAYASARQQNGSLFVPPLLARAHLILALGGVVVCIALLPVAFTRRAPCAGFLLAALVALPLNAAIAGGLSAPHDRYQSRIMWLPPFVAAASIASLRRRTA